MSLATFFWCEFMLRLHTVSKSILSSGADPDVESSEDNISNDSKNMGVSADLEFVSDWKKKWNKIIAYLYVDKNFF